MSLYKGVYGGADEQQDNKGAYDDADDAQAGQPLFVIPADGLEHAPETVVEVQPQGYEPNDVQGQDPPLAEGGHEEVVRVLCLAAHELLQLHFCPEVGEVEAQETKDDNTKHEHVLGAPAVVLGLGGNLIALYAATALEVLDAEPDTIADMDKEAQSQDGNHDVNHGRGHEVAAQLEPAVPVGVGVTIQRHLAKIPMKGVDDGEEVNGAMQEQEDDKECTRDALDKLLADRRG